MDDCNHIWNGKVAIFGGGNSASITCSLCLLPFVFSKEAEYLKINFNYAPVGSVIPVENLTKGKRKRGGQAIMKSKRQTVYDRDGNKCLRCGSKYRLTLDHVIPVCKGGSSDYDNLQTLCHSCNNEKADEIIDYRDTSTDLSIEEAVAYFQQCLDERRQEREKKKNGLPWADFKKQLFDDLEREKISQLRFVKTEREDYNDRKPDVAELKMMTAK